MMRYVYISIGFLPRKLLC